MPDKLKVTWAVFYKDPSADSCSYLAYLQPKVDPTQALSTIVEKVFADPELASEGPLVGHNEGDFFIVFYELPEWPCSLDTPENKIKTAFAGTINVKYLGDECIKLPEEREYAEIKQRDNLAVVLKPLPRSSRPPLDTVPEEGSAMLDRETIASEAHKRQSPSTGAKPGEMMKVQTVERPDRVYKARPLELSGPPMQLYHSAFATFHRLMRDPQPVSDEECGHALEYIAKCSKFYPSEDERKKNMIAMTRAVHPRILDGADLKYSSGRFLPDGLVRSSKMPSAHNLAPVLAIHELKNEIGSGGSDPFAQAECCYIAFYCSDEARTIRQISACPCFLIGTAGPYIMVGGAVFADRLIVQQFSIVSIIPGPTQPERSLLADAVYRVAKLFRALKTSLDELDDYYSHHLAAPAPPVAPSVAPSVASAGTSQVGHSRAPAPRRPSPSTQVSSSTRARTPAPRAQQLPYIGPHFTAFTKSDGTKVTLEYTGRLAQEEFSKTVFTALAHTDTGTDVTKVVVKFAHAYSHRGHDLLSGNNPPLAPTLWFCAYEESVDMYVVVMDFVPSRTGPLSDSDHKCLGKALEILHGADLVFGDLRRPNVLQCHDGGTMLIDFDWCGKVNEVHYPHDIRLGDTMPWHESVKPGGTITKEHDDHLLEELFGKSELGNAAPTSGGEPV